MSVSLFALCFALISEPDEQEKFQKLYDSYKNDMFIAAYSILKDHELAEDAVQNGMLRISKVIEKINLNKNPRSFVIAVAQNAAKDIVSKKDRERVLYDSYISTFACDNECTIEENIENNDLIDRVADYVLSMNRIYSDVFILRFYHELKYSEISQLLNVSEQTLRKRIERLKIMLYEFIENEQK